MRPQQVEGSACCRKPFLRPGGLRGGLRRGSGVLEQLLHGDPVLAGADLPHLGQQLLDAREAEHMVQEQLDVFIGENLGLVAQVHGQFAAALIDAEVAILPRLSFDLLIQFCLLRLDALHCSFQLVQLFAHRSPPSLLILLPASKGKGTGCLISRCPLL